MSNNNIRTDALDFEEIKENLKEYLRGQSQFSDYDFDGSAMSILLDILAYNTHYNSLYTNMAVNEMFLDSATKYSSVVSLAKTLGYTARSVTSARAKVNVIVETDASYSSLILPRGTIFTGSVGTEEFDFIVDSDYQAQNISGTITSGKYRFNDVVLIEGTLMNKRYTNKEGVEFVVPSKQADMSTLTVKVQDNASSSNYVGFGKADSVLTVDSSSNVFFVRQREDLYYEVYFGNGTIGKNISAGNVVHLNYVLSSGINSNYAGSFAYSSGIGFDYSSIVVETVETATGGSDLEEIDSIRFNAPRAFSTQNRAVTIEDYKNILYSNYPYIDAITAWGGQENDPPIYGKVFISIAPSAGFTLTEAQKIDIVNFLKNSKGVVSITPEIIDPKYIKVELTSNVYYNKNTTRRTPGEIQSIVKSSIERYAETLGKFGFAFRHSKVNSLITAADDAITSNITTIRLRVDVIPQYNKNYKYDVKIGNPIYQNPAGGSFLSTRFYINSSTVTDRCYLKDDGRGNVLLFSEDTKGVAKYIMKVGTINYKTGSVSITEINIKGLYDEMLEFVVAPLSFDIIPVRQYIISLPADLIKINMLIDNVETVGSTNTSYNFSSSR
jgi:hypothetical protein